MTQQEQKMLTLFEGSRTIVQAIDESEFDDYDGLNIIKSLLEKGALIKIESPARTQKIYDVEKWSKDYFRTKSSKSTYSHIFTLFQKQNRNTPQNTSSVDNPNGQNGQRHVGRKIHNQIRLTKAELLLIRQKLEH